MSNREVKYILSLTGGGIRNAITASFLDEMMQILKIDMSVFDLIVGVSGGAMLAMQGVQNIEKKSWTPAKNLFSQQNVSKICNKSILDRVMREVQFSPVYDGTGKTLVLKKYFGDAKMGQVSSNVAIPIYNLYKKKTELCTTYDDDGKELSVAQVCDAATAAIPYFPPVNIHDTLYVDGGFGAPEPVFLAYTEARKLYGPDCAIRILSVGAGQKIPDEKWKSNSVEKWGTIQWLGNGLIDLLLDAPGDALIDNIGRLMTRESNKNRLLHINPELPMTVSLDNSDREVIEMLFGIGKSAFVGQKNDLVDFFNAKSSRSWCNERNMYWKKSA
jgi:predicted patatin/cPLA2 family phospholipase